MDPGGVHSNFLNSIHNYGMDCDCTVLLFDYVGDSNLEFADLVLSHVHCYVENKSTFRRLEDDGEMYNLFVSLFDASHDSDCQCVRSLFKHCEAIVEDQMMKEMYPVEWHANTAQDESPSAS